MVHYLPGTVLALFGIVAYAIGCVLFLNVRRQRAEQQRRAASGAAGGNAESSTPPKAMFAYAIAMMILGMLALAGGLYTLEIIQIRSLGG